MNALFDNNEGQNWKPSIMAQGTPGVANSVAASDIAQVITSASHFPLVPTHLEQVSVFAKMTDDHASAITATLFWRLDGAASFNSTAMADDGVYGAILAAQADKVIVEYYFQATDATAPYSGGTPTSKYPGRSARSYARWQSAPRCPAERDSPSAKRGPARRFARSKIRSSIG